MSKSKKLNAAEAARIEAAIQNADYFTACRFIGPQGGGKSPYERVDCPSLDAAIAACANWNGRGMIYAVTADGRTVHVRNA